MRYRDKLTGQYVSRATWLRSRAHGGTRYVTVPGKAIPRPKVKSTKPRGVVPVKEARKRPVPTRKRPAKRPEPKRPSRKPTERRKPVKRPPAKKAPAKKPPAKKPPAKKPPAKKPPARAPESPVLIRWRYQHRGGQTGSRGTDVEAVMYRGRIVAARVGSGRRSYFYDDPRSLVDLQRLFNTMPGNAERIPAKRGDWWDN